MEKDSQELEVVASPADLTSGKQSVAPVQTWPFPPPPGLPPVERMLQGFGQFKRGMFDMYPDLFCKLANGQEPEFMVFSCSDSRVCPSHVLNFWPGEAFMFRNIANLVPPFQARDSGVGAAIEYAVLHLKVKNIVVIGHSRCGGIQALMELPDDGSTSSEFIEDWVKIGLPARAKVQNEYPNLTPEQQLPLLEREAVKLSVSNLQTYPFVQQAVETGSLNLYGAYYDFVDGHFEAPLI